jgi:hypothetical protein
MVMRVLIFGILGVVLPLSPARGRVPGAQIYNSSLRFVANAGQSDPAVRFQLDAAGETIFFTPEAVSFVAGGSPREQVSSDPIRLRFVAANPAPAVEGVERVGLRAPDRPIFPREIPIRRRPTAPMYSWPSSTPMAS